MTVILMQTSDKVRTGLYLSPKVDESLRIFAVRHRISNSDVVEAMIVHCLSNKHFVEKLTKKEEDCEI
jgi:hypothetical protein